MAYNSIVYLKKLVDDYSKNHCSIVFQRNNNETSCYSMTANHHPIYLDCYRKNRNYFEDFPLFQYILSYLTLEISRVGFAYFGELYYPVADSKGAIQKHLMTVKKASRLSELLEQLEIHILANYRNLELQLKGHSNAYLEIYQAGEWAHASFLLNHNNLWNGKYDLDDNFLHFFPSIKRNIAEGKSITIHYLSDSVIPVFEIHQEENNVVASSLFEAFVMLERRINDKHMYLQRNKKQEIM